MRPAAGGTCSSSPEARSCLLEVGRACYFHDAPLTLPVLRLPGSQPAADGRTQATRSATGSRRLPAERDDVRELPEAARVQLEGGDAREAARGDEGGRRQLPPLVKKQKSKHASLSPSLLCYALSRLPTHIVRQ
jgi:hypothetical protein